MTEAEIASERRRLSLGVCDPVKLSKNSDSSRTVNTAEFGEQSNRGLFVKLKNCDISQLASGSATKGAPTNGRRLSFSSSTDKQKKDKNSFEEKDTVNEGAEKVTQDTLRQMGIGICCRKGLKPESPNQDSFSFTCVGGENGFSLYGVYDGHGPAGHDVSQFVKEMLPKLFLQHDKRTSDPEQALSQAFIKCQELVVMQQDEKKIDATMSGCTTSVVFRPHHDQFIIVAHVGDSRAVLSGPGADAFTELTIDHKPNLAKEKERIEASGGRVVFDGFYNYRVFAKGAMYPGLNMSRALGDTLAHNSAGISGVPDVERAMIKTETIDGKEVSPILLLCTDGVWEFIESKEASAMVQGRKGTIQDVANKLSQESWDRWLADSDGEISDDITAFLVDLNVKQT